MLEPKPNTSLFYIYYYPNDDIDAKKEYIYYLQDRQGKQKLTNKQDKKNCEFTIKQVIPKSDAVTGSSPQEIALEVERQKKLLKEKIAKLNKNVKDVKKIDENERKKTKFNSELGRINSIIIRQQNKIKNKKSKQIDDKIGDIIDIDNEISEVDPPNRTVEQNKKEKEKIDAN